MEHMTRDIWHVTHLRTSTFSLCFRYLAYTVRSRSQIMTPNFSKNCHFFIIFFHTIQWLFSKYVYILVYKILGVQHILQHLYHVHSGGHCENPPQIPKPKDFLKRDISCLLGGSTCIFFICYKNNVRMESLVDIKRDIQSCKP